MRCLWHVMGHAPESSVALHPAAPPDDPCVPEGHTPHRRTVSRGSSTAPAPADAADRAAGSPRAGRGTVRAGTRARLDTEQSLGRPVHSVSASPWPPWARCFWPGRAGGWSAVCTEDTHSLSPLPDPSASGCRGGSTCVRRGASRGLSGSPNI